MLLPSSPVEKKLELSTADKNHETTPDENHKIQEVGNSKTDINNTSLAQDLNSEAHQDKISEKSQKEKSEIVKPEPVCIINVKPLQELLKPQQPAETTQLIISSHDLHSQSSECTIDNVTSDLNSESENNKNNENVVHVNNGVKQESLEESAQDTNELFYGFDSVSDKYSKFLKVLGKSSKLITF